MPTEDAWLLMRCWELSYTCHMGKVVSLYEPPVCQSLRSCRFRNGFVGYPPSRPTCEWTTILSARWNRVHRPKMACNPSNHGIAVCELGVGNTQHPARGGIRIRLLLPYHPDVHRFVICRDTLRLLRISEVRGLTWLADGLSGLCGWVPALSGLMSHVPKTGGSPFAVSVVPHDTHTQQSHVTRRSPERGIAGCQF